MTQPKLMTVDEAAAYLRIGRWTLYKLLRRGAIPGAKVGHLWRIRRADLEAYVRGTGGPAWYEPRERGGHDVGTNAA